MACGLWYYLYTRGFLSWLTLEKLQAHHVQLNYFVQAHPLRSALIFMTIFAMAIVACLPVTPLLTVASGAFFGGFFGGMYSLIGALSGAVISLYCFRYLFRDCINHQKNEQLAVFQKDFDAHGFSYLLSLMLFPGTPFAVINMLAGISFVPLWKFIAAMIIALIPGTFIYAYAGKEFTALESINDIFSWHFTLLFALLALASLAPVLIEKYRDWRS